jgi:carboxymethylenebutenolidase
MRDDDAPAYLAGPPGRPAGGVLVVHDWFGLLLHVRTLCDQLAGAGLVALAPDLYEGRATTDPEQAERLMDGLEAARARARLDAALDQLRTRTRGGPVGGLGFSMGGSLALDRAARGTLDAVACYYATVDEQEAAGIRCPVLLHLAEVDEWDPRETPERFMAGLRATGTPVQVHSWPGTEHSFANGDVAAHAPAQAARAWAATLEFLRGHLTPDAPGRASG